jgi:hypothetical protein
MASGAGITPPQAALSGRCCVHGAHLQVALNQKPYRGCQTQ